MIVKEHQAPPTQDKLQRAGDEAEKQMAFYLRRAFGTDPNVHVFHNLRFEQGEDAAQIDHVVLHRAGAIIIESKSVTSAVRINERDEWTRQWNGRWTGMPSPVLQAKRQAQFLGRYLSKHHEELLGKFLFGIVQKNFGAFIIDVVVAISDQGVIEYKGHLDEVRKADQVPDFVRERMQEHKRLASGMKLDKRVLTEGLNLSAEEFMRVSAFLRNRHRDRSEASAAQASGGEKPSKGTPVWESTATPLVVMHEVPSVGTAGQPSTPQATSQDFACRRCQSSNLQVVYGKYGYYFKCQACEGNTPIQLTCPTCGDKQRTRKSGNEFFAECSSCNTSVLYFTNS